MSAKEKHQIYRDVSSLKTKSSKGSHVIPAIWLTQHILSILNLELNIASFPKSTQHIAHCRQDGALRVVPTDKDMAI